MEFKYYLDLDGCFTDYWGTWEKLHGIHPKEYRKNHTYDEYLKLTESGGTDFWAQMDWMPDGAKWWSHMSQFKDDICILSYPLTIPSCIPGKLEWVVNNLGLPESQCIFDQDKAKHCKEWNDLLIDDTCSNLEAWRKAGGIAIQHTTAESSINIVEALRGIEVRELVSIDVQEISKGADLREDENKERDSERNPETT